MRQTKGEHEERVRSEARRGQWGRGMWVDESCKWGGLCTVVMGDGGSRQCMEGAREREKELVKEIEEGGGDVDDDLGGGPPEF